MTARTLLVSLAVIGLAVGATPAAAPGRGQGAQQPTFRSGVIAVPIEVRVLDKDRRPIADLREQDFTILEDGVPQKIVHFAVQALAAQAPGRDIRARPDAARAVAAAGPVPPSGADPAAPSANPAVPPDLAQSHRIFLIVLGRGTLDDPQRHGRLQDLDALLRFVRERLLPQDQVALLAYNRATDFTADHEKVAATLERLRAGGRAALVGQGMPAPASTASVFRAPEALDPSPAVTSDLGLEEYLKAHTQALDELDSLFYGIKYLRFMEGEKHLVYVTVRGFEPPAWDPTCACWDFRTNQNFDHVNQLARAANDARVALDTIQIGEHAIDLRMPRDMPAPPGPEPRRFVGGATGGAEGLVGPTGGAAGAAGAGGGQPSSTAGDTVTISSPTPAQSFFAGLSPLSGAIGNFVDYNLKQAAELTGGQASMYGDTEVALGRIDAGTRISYLLAYYPSNAQWDGRYRRVTVQVNREGATVLYRHGYSARQEVAFDRRRMLADSHIESAGSSLAAARDIGLKVTPVFTKAATGPGGELSANLVIDATRWGWSVAADGRHAAHLDVSVYCGDGNEKILGHGRRVLNLALTEESYLRARTQGFAYTLKVPATGRIRIVKVVVYDYDTALVGSTVVKVK